MGLSPWRTVICGTVASGDSSRGELWGFAKMDDCCLRVSLWGVSEESFGDLLYRIKSARFVLWCRCQDAHPLAFQSLLNN